MRAIASNHVRIKAPPERVFEVLAEPDSYADWVVGSQSIRDADPSWPAIGARFYHRVGVGPLRVNDHTEVVAVDAPRRLVLRARARPLGTAMITLTAQTLSAGGTELIMEEGPGDVFSRLLFNPFTDPLVALRNSESLRRLKRIAEAGVVKP